MSATTPTADLLSPRLQRRKDLSMVTQDIRAKAEVYYGDETCRKKVMSLLTETGLPSGLLTVLEAIEEHGYIKDTGFVWLKHKSKRKEHKFDKIAVCYDSEVTAYFEPNRIKNLTGVKAKDFLIWITLSEIQVNGNNPDGLVTFKTPAGFSKSFQLSLLTFKAEEEAKMKLMIHEARIGKTGGETVNEKKNYSQIHSYWSLSLLAFFTIFRRINFL